MANPINNQQTPQIKLTMINIISKLPNLLILIIIFITTFLLSFLLLSCYSEAEAYSEVYLTRFKFNEDQLSIVNFNSNTTSEEISEFSIDIGYMNFCVNYNKDKTCSLFSNINKVDDYPLIAVDGDNNATIDLRKLARNFNGICFPWILMASLIMVLSSLVVITWIILPLLPWKLWARKILSILCLINGLTWGVGAMLQHEAAKASSALIPFSSIQLIDVTPGVRAESVTWTAFTMIVVVFIGNSILLYREVSVVIPKLQVPLGKAYY